MNEPDKKYATINGCVTHLLSIRYGGDNCTFCLQPILEENIESLALSDTGVVNCPDCIELINWCIAVKTA